MNKIQNIGNRFKCPNCGGSLFRKVNKPSPNPYIMQSPVGNPVCNKCGMEFTIRINEDLSYDIF